jgi:hypothetical protein
VPHALCIGAPRHPVALRRTRGPGLLCSAILVALLAFLAFGASAMAASTSQLSVTRIGWGHGAITSAPAGISCGATCQANVASGSAVTLTAVAAADSTFTGWTGACTGASATCTVAMSAATSATASFTLLFPVTITAAYTGSGSIFSSPLTILCGDSFFTCQADVSAGSDVTLQAVPATGSSFSSWGGACSGQPAICTVHLSEAQSVTANFTPLVRLEISVAGPQYGSVTSSPAGIACGANCRAGFVNGSVVTLTAVALPGEIFGGWGGACAGIEPTCAVSMVAVALVTATFTPPLVDVSVAKAGTGSGSVTTDLPAIDCGVACDGDVPYGTTVAFTATAAPGSTFTGWSGACHGAATTCTYRLTTTTSSWPRSPPIPPRLPIPPRRRRRRRPRQCPARAHLPASPSLMSFRSRRRLRRRVRTHWRPRRRPARRSALAPGSTAALAREQH